MSSNLTAPTTPTTKGLPQVPSLARTASTLACLFLLTAAWPVVARALELEADQREALLTELVERTLRAHGREETLER